ncbi:hypothetical protein BS78_04G121700, partial [Paspalum vaginatum]
LLCLQWQAVAPPAIAPPSPGVPLEAMTPTASRASHGHDSCRRHNLPWPAAAPSAAAPPTAGSASRDPPSSCSCRASGGRSQLLRRPCLPSLARLLPPALPPPPAATHCLCGPP